MEGMEGDEGEAINHVSIYFPSCCDAVSCPSVSLHS